MKLLSATVRNYRTHRDTTVHLDDGLVLIHGPNESGKSTLAEAIHRALFLRATTGGEFQKGMRSSHGSSPSVELHFEADGKRHTLRKQFSGPNGMATLESEGSQTLSGDAAEESLSRLLKVDGTIGGRGASSALEKRWGHLWVRQGHSDATPLDSIEESQDHLRAKLQASSGQSILSSPVDDQVIRQLSDWESQNLTNRGFKANSDLDKAQKALNQAQDRAESARETLDALRQAAADYEQAEADIARHAKNHADAEKQLAAIEEKLKTVTALRGDLKEKSRLREEAEKALTTLQEADSEIRGFESQLKEAEQAAAPKKKEIEGLRTDAKKKQTDYEDARRVREQTSTTLNHTRAIAEAWQAHGDSLRQAKRIDELNKQLKQIEKLQTKAKKITKALAPLEDFTARSVKRLATSEHEADQARLKLEAYALQVEILESDQSITLDGQPLDPGSKEILSHAAELRIGDGTRLRLNPGGAKDLEAASKDSERAATKHADTLKALGVDSVEAAREQLRKRENLEKELESLEEQLEAAEADEAGAERDEAEKTFAQLQSRRDASVPKGEAIDFPDDLQATEAAAGTAREALKAATEAHDSAEAREKATRSTAEKATRDLATSEEAQKTANEHINDLKSKLTYALEKSGESQARSEAINQARAKFDQAQAAAQSLSKELDELGADQLDLDAKRLRAAVESDGNKLKDAENRKVVAQTRLSSSGTQDPESELKQAEAETARSQQRFDQLKHQADVRQHLLDKLRAARQATTAALAQPLEDAVNPYLKSLFGGSRARLHWADDGSRLKSFELDRTDQQNGLYTFEDLSHGTREQVALALRLAMAELLAADHDGCLPLVLDDAFTHADQDRIEKLKSLLFQASQNGLQIILLSCHPENYSGLSASEAALTKQAPESSPPSSVSPHPPSPILHP